jgi:hypothetical protein
VLDQRSTKRRDCVLVIGLSEWTAPDPSEVGRRRAIAVDVHAGVNAREPALGARELGPRGDLLLGSVAPEPGVDRALLRGRGEVSDSGLEGAQRRLERVEDLPLDLRPGADGQDPGRDLG